MSEKEINDIISRNLSYYLDLRNKTQLDLAEHMGVSQATVSNWCTGVKMPRMKKIDAICEYLGVKRSDLMEEKSEVQTSGHNKVYYQDAETAKLAQEMLEDSDMRALFHMKKNMDAARFKAHMNMMKELYKLEHPEEYPEDY